METLESVPAPVAAIGEVNDSAQRPPPDTPGRLQQSLTNYPNRPAAQRAALQRSGWPCQSHHSNNHHPSQTEKEEKRSDGSQSIAWNEAPRLNATAQRDASKSENKDKTTHKAERCRRTVGHQSITTRPYQNWKRRDEKKPPQPDNACDQKRNSSDERQRLIELVHLIEWFNAKDHRSSPEAGAGNESSVPKTRGIETEARGGGSCASDGSAFSCVCNLSWMPERKTAQYATSCSCKTSTNPQGAQMSGEVWMLWWKWRSGNTDTGKR
jgi:hypothetical protein